MKLFRLRAKDGKWLGLSLGLLMVLMSTTSYATSLVTINPDGVVLSRFNIDVSEDEGVEFVEVDSDGAIWVGRGDLNQSQNETKPRDAVLKYDSTGSESLRVKGPIRSPRSIAFDSGGRIYVGAVADGGSLTSSSIYRFDSEGGFQTSFGEVFELNGWDSLTFGAGNRLYGKSRLADASVNIHEFTMDGALVRRNGTRDGRAVSGEGLAFGPDGSVLWAYEGFNGSNGDDLFAAYDADLNPIGSIDLGREARALFGLRVLESGNIVVRDRTTNRILEYTVAGFIVNEIDLAAYGSLAGTGRGLAIDRQGNYVFEVIPEPSSAVLLGLGLLGMNRFRSRVEGAYGGFVIRDSSF